MQTANAIVVFLASLHGMDIAQRIDVTQKKVGALDLLTGQAIETTTDFPDGEMLVVRRLGFDLMHLVHAHKVVDALLVRHANAQAIKDGESVTAHYKAIREHLTHKTGYSY